MDGVVADHGVPLAVYRDGHAVFEVAEHEPMTLEEQLAGKKGVTQFGRLLEELNVTSIRSRSPQARGRIEQLWGTLQDRLVSELRLAGARTVTEANATLREYLPIHNRKFAVPATRPGSAFRSPGREWRAHFCLKHERTVGHDNVVRFGDLRLQILPNGRLSYAKAKVEVREGFDGFVSVYYQGHRLETQPAPAEAPKLRQTPVNITPKPRQTTKPPPDHPWRRSMRYYFDGPPRH